MEQGLPARVVPLQRRAMEDYHYLSDTSADDVPRTCADTQVAVGENKLQYCGMHATNDGR
jgi:hypothetical protein